MTTEPMTTDENFAIAATHAERAEQLLGAVDEGHASTHSAVAAQIHATLAIYYATLATS